jgi:tRNA (mo5U34)-methyltransferase
MIYISYGVPKSASTFTYVVTEQVLKVAGHELVSVSEAVKGRKSRLNYIDPITWSAIESVVAETGGRSAVIKTHGAPDKRLLEAIGRRGVFASAVMRDPRDIALSLLDHARRSRDHGGGDFAELKTLDDTLKILDEQFDRLTRWVECSQVLLLTYDEISFSTEAAVQRIINQLGLSVAAKSVISALPVKGKIEQFNKGVRLRHESEMPVATQQIFLDRYGAIYRKYLGGVEVIPRVRRVDHADVAADVAPMGSHLQAGRSNEAALDIGSATIEETKVSQRATEHAADMRKSSPITSADADKLRWFHSIDLGDGIITKGRRSLESIRHNADVVFKDGVEGKTVLDIGAWDGAFSFESERRGAARVLATDHFSWVGPGWGKKESFDFARKAIGSRVETKLIDVPDISSDTVGRFDVVLFLGVLYHLLHPLLMLERIAPIARELLVVETETALDDEDRPAMVFFPGAELNNDATNWWAPNIKCMEAMLRHVGFTRIEVSPTWGFDGKITHRRGRFMFHAWK